MDELNVDKIFDDIVAESIVITESLMDESIDDMINRLDDQFKNGTIDDDTYKTQKNMLEKRRQNEYENIKSEKMKKKEEDLKNRKKKISSFLKKKSSTNVLVSEDVDNDLLSIIESTSTIEHKLSLIDSMYMEDKINDEDFRIIRECIENNVSNAGTSIEVESCSIEPLPTSGILPNNAILNGLDEEQCTDDALNGNFIRDIPEDSSPYITDEINEKKINTEIWKKDDDMTSLIPLRGIPITRGIYNMNLCMNDQVGIEILNATEFVADFITNDFTDLTPLVESSIKTLTDVIYESSFLTEKTVDLIGKKTVLMEKYKSTLNEGCKNELKKDIIVVEKEIRSITKGLSEDAMTNVEIVSYKLQNYIVESSSEDSIISKIKVLIDSIIEKIRSLFDKSSKLEEARSAIDSDKELKKTSIKTIDYNKLHSLEKTSAEKIMKAQTERDVYDIIEKYKKQRNIILGTTAAVTITLGAAITHVIKHKNEKITNLENTKKSLEREYADLQKRNKDLIDRVSTLKDKNLKMHENIKKMKASPSERTKMKIADVGTKVSIQQKKLEAISSIIKDSSQSITSEASSIISSCMSKKGMIKKVKDVSTGTSNIVTNIKKVANGTTKKDVLQKQLEETQTKGKAMQERIKKMKMMLNKEKTSGKNPQLVKQLSNTLDAEREALRSNIKLYKSIETQLSTMKESTNIDLVDLTKLSNDSLIFYQESFNEKLVNAYNHDNIESATVYENKLKYINKRLKEFCAITEDVDYFYESKDMEDEIRTIVADLNKKGYKVKYASPGHLNLRKKEDKDLDGLYYGKLYSDARVVFDKDYGFPNAPKYWYWKQINDNRDYLDVKDCHYNSKDGSPNEAFSKWKTNYMNSLREWVSKLSNKNDSKEEDKRNNKTLEESTTQNDDFFNNFIFFTESTDKSIMDDNYHAKGKKDLSSMTKIDCSNTKALSKYYNNDKYNCLKNINKWKKTKEGMNGYVYVDNDELVGYVLVSDHNINPIYICPKYRGYGLSEQMMDVAINELGANRLWAWKDNEIAVNLYKSKGFVIDKQKTDYKGDEWYDMKLKSNTTTESCQLYDEHKFLIEISEQCDEFIDELLD